MEEVSTSYESVIEADLSTNQDPKTIVEAVYDDENLPDYEDSQTDSPSKFHETNFSYQHKCPLCERSFKNVGHLKNHYGRSHRNSTPLLFLFDSSLTCKICNKHFSFKSEFDSHNVKYHIQKNGTKPIVQSHRCNICKKRFRGKSALENHYHDHNNDSEEVKKPNKQLFKCDVCSANFSTKRSLKCHDIVHTKREFVCEVCKKSFRLMNSLNQHSICHTKERCYQCKVCDMYFARRSALEAHERIHCNEKSYGCE